MPARAAAGADDAARGSWLICRAGTLLCALPIAQVVEIMRPLPIERILGAPQYVSGLSIIRGQPIPVVDLGLIIGDRSAQATRLIAVQAAARMVALAVSAVLGISIVEREALTQMPPLLRDISTEAVAAVGALDSELIVFLQAARLVPEDVLACLTAEEKAS